MLSCASSDIAGSVNCSRKDSMDWAEVRLPRSLRISSSTVSSPARESQKAVAAPTIPPPITTASAVAGQVSAVGVKIYPMRRLLKT